jgi:hypothetical protein
MIANAHRLYVTLHQLSSFTDMLEATHHHAKEKNDLTLFPLVSEGCTHIICELNAVIREYLQAHPKCSRENVSSWPPDRE